MSLAKYLTLDYEVPAFIQGLYKRAKTKKILLQQAIDEFFDERSGELTDEEETNVRKVWDRWIRLNLPQVKLNEGVKDDPPEPLVFTLLPFEAPNCVLEILAIFVAAKAPAKPACIAG